LTQPAKLHTIALISPHRPDLARGAQGMVSLAMHRVVPLVIALGILSSGICEAQTSKPAFQNFNAPGNLETTVDLACITLDKVSAQYNPVDLFRAVRACLVAKRYDDAAGLHLLAMTFGRFDMARVADQTAHQAISVAQMEIYGGVSPADRQTFGDHAKLVMDDPKIHTAFCQALVRIGPPTYFPRYMIQHGMGAFLGNSGNGLVKDFDPAASWTMLVQTGRKCLP
jgi:5-carboxymethyl-2-hydroxymuconate isomerase